MSKTSTTIRYAVLHSAIFVPDLGQHGPTLTAGGVGKSPVTGMISRDGMLEVTIKGKTLETVLIPLTAVSHMVEAKT